LLAALLRLHAARAIIDVELAEGSTQRPILR